MQAGDVFAERFELLELAGSGGMGKVFRARDLTTGEAVAVKVLLQGSEPQAARFEREAMLLAELQHPGIVGYIAHGETQAGAPFIAMEWLSGEDLQARLARQRLSLSETLTLVEQAAKALAVAHARGVIHRDFKPSNLFLVGGSPACVKVLDFGIAWFGGSTRVTHTGALVGTPSYMAPEQARSGQEIDVRADVFALGCVLFECLTGVRAFSGDHAMAVLAKILFDESPRARDLRPDLPAVIDELCADMMAKDPAQRPPDAEAVAAAIGAISSGKASVLRSDADVGPPSSRPRPSLTVSERRLLSVALIGSNDPLALPTAVTLAVSDLALLEEQLRRRAAAYGGRLEALADGSVIVSIVGTTRSATDQAAQAARCAIALREAADDRPIALATGRGVETGQMPVGEAIDRAAALIASRAAAEQARPKEGAEAPGGKRPIAIDDATAGLLGPWFEVTHGELGLLLHGERRASDEVRTLLGKPSPCVGRDREIAALSGLWDQCTDEGVAVAVLVLGAAGIGKSRLAHELTRAVRQRGGEVEIWIGRAEPLRSGSALGLLSGVMGSACGLHVGEDLNVRRQKIWARVSARVAEADQARVAEFLGELLDTPLHDDEPATLAAGQRASVSASSPGASKSAPITLPPPPTSTPPSPALRAARQDAQVMGDQIRKACLDLLAAECSARPVLLVLEDLHWADLPTAQFIDAALRVLREKPWMVLALARPEVHERFPKLWAGRDVQETRLRELTRKASERLVRLALGDRVGQATVDRLVALSDGHAFFLEELIRAASEGRGSALPETVIATVQARLAGQSPQARRILRAASVFGEQFWQGGVVSLLGGDMPPTQAGYKLSALVDQEVLVRRAESRFAGDPEFAFRHALLREGAYAMLTEDDRVLGHKLAAAYLDQAGEPDPMVIAEHYERGRESARAGSFYFRAAEQAFRGGDLDAGMARATRGLECGVPDALRIKLLSLLSEGYLWRHQWGLAAGYAEEVMRLAEPGSAPWAMAAVAKLVNAQALGRMDEFTETLRLLLDVKPTPDALSAAVMAVSIVAFILNAVGRFDLTTMCIDQLRALIEPAAEAEVMTSGERRSHERAVGAPDRTASGAAPPAARPSASAGSSESGVIPSDRVDYQRHAAPEASRPPDVSDVIEVDCRLSVLIAHVSFAMHLWMLGAHDAALRAIDVTRDADDMLGPLVSIKRMYFVGMLADSGALDEARREAESAIEIGARRHLRVDEGRGRWSLAEVLRRTGELASAEEQALAAVELLTIVPMDHLAALATLAAVKLATGRVEEALREASEVVGRLEAFGFDYKGVFARAVHAEALWASGDRGAARRAIAAARDRVLENAGRIGDPELRRSYLERVPENARTLDLAEEWLREATAS